jgi:hypothetical protein
MLSQDHHGKLLVKVIDFGIAKSLAEGESGHGLTQTGMFLGKLKYASPEQAGFLKEGEHLDPRSDLYSFGIVLYEMLAGRAPFQATNPHGYILKHVTEKPAGIAELNPAARVPAQLESIIFRSLEKSRDNRYRTAADFAAALEAVRSAVPPDEKYGLGERLVTLSAAKTLADLPKYTPTSGGTLGSAPTQMTQAGSPPATGPTGTRAAANEATVLERNLTASGAAPQGTIGGNEATVLERVGGGAAATVLEPKTGWGSAAEATVLEKQIAAPKKKTPLVAAIAAILVVALAIGAWVMLRDDGSKTIADKPATDTAPSGVVVNTDTTRPIAQQHGVLLLSATPWGDIEKIVNAADQQPVDITDDDRSTPTRLVLDPGKYMITVKGPAKSETFDVQIEAGKTERKTVSTGTVNYDELTQEMSRP